MDIDETNTFQFKFCI